MIYFITNCPIHLEYYNSIATPNIEVLEDNEETYKFFVDWAAKKYLNEDKYIGYDVESNGLDAWINSTIFKILGDEEIQFVFHTPFCNFRRYMLYIYDKFGFLGHNIKFDLKFTSTEDRLNIFHVYDTMIAEQRIYMKSGLRFALEQLLLRYLDVYPDVSDKSVRDEFVGVDIHKFKVEPRHIYYAVGDVDKLFIIKRKQQEKIDKYNLNFLIYDIEFPLISIIAKAELEGWDFNKEKWIQIAKDNQKARFELECKMDDEVRRLRDLIFPKNRIEIDIDYQRAKMVGGKWDNKRMPNPAYDFFNSDGTTNTLNLFGEPMKTNTYLKSKAKKTVKIKKNPNNINYGSDTQIIEIFGRLQEPIMEIKENLVVPRFTKTGKIDRTIQYRTGEDYFTIYRNQLPNSKMLPFVDMLMKHRALSTAIETFGENVVGKINKVTGKLHTEFRQANAATGRMQSGGGKGSDKINSQNIPSRAKWAIPMRNCFIAPKGYSIGTHDYTGAELIVMCSLSQDMNLLKISKKDMHSYVAQKCWRAIYKYRAIQLIKKVEKIRKNKGDPTYVGGGVSDLVSIVNKFLVKAKSYIVDKTTENGKVRQAFKPLTFKEKFVFL